MATPHTWTDAEDLAWRTWELPEALKAEASHNLAEIERFVRSRGYIVEHGLLNLLVECSSDLRPRLRFEQPSSRSLGDVMVSALQARPETVEPTPFQGDSQHKAVEAGLRVTDQPLSATEMARLRDQAKTEHQRRLEESRKLKQALEETQAKFDCESMTANNRSGTAIDHVFVNLLQQIFAKNADGSVNWVVTRNVRKRYLDEHQWRLEHGQPTTPSIPLRK